MTQQRRHFFLDVDDDMSLPQIFAEARILTLQLLHFFRHGIALGLRPTLLRCRSAAWVGPPLRGQDARPAGCRQGLSLHCAAARYARLRFVPRQPLPPPTQHQKNSRSYLLSSSPCSLIKTTGGVSEMLARRAATKLKTIQLRAQAKDYQDIAAWLDTGLSLAEALAAAGAIYGKEFNGALSLKALSYFEDGDLP